MAEAFEIAGPRRDFYKDSFSRVIIILISLLLAIVFLIGMALYFHFKKPAPITFPISAEWRVQPPIPLNQPYLTTPDLLQWVSNVLPSVFVYDFDNYNDQLKEAAQYFTKDGWKVFLNQLNIYVNYNNVQTYKMFVNGVPSSAPYILNEGLLSGRYGWWVQIPIDLTFTGYNRSYKQTLVLQVLVIRVPTLNNLMGVGIDNVIVAKATTTN